jgi:methylenetetrahydrofolate dehydrogenase (NADP+)/methenyltetrahydrofolate cyclohydrolase
MQLMDGSLVAQQIKEELAHEVLTRKSKGMKIPHLAAVLVGEDGASLTYVSSKVKSCEQIGFGSTLIQLPESVSQSQLIDEIEKLNDNQDIDGYIIQLPLPAHINEKAVLQHVSPDKDVDGFHPECIGKMALGMDTFLPATPAGILELIKRYQIETSGKNCVVVGRSHIVGMPISLLMQRNSYPGNATVTTLHSKSANIKEVCAQADILIVAIGKPGYVTADMVKEGAVVIDVGITRVADDTKKSGFRIAGDVDFHSVAPKCSWITPVPGGVGPMTIASLLINTMKSVKLKEKIETKGNEE